MRDDDRLLDLPDAEFGSGVIGVCDICGTRQAVVVLTKERFRLCVLDFLNKTWLKTDKKPGEPVPLYRSERVFFDTAAVPSRRAPAIALRPTKVVRHPAVLIVPDVYGITTTLVEAAIRFAREGFEVLTPDLGKTDGIAAAPMLLARGTARFRGGVDTRSAEVTRLVRLLDDALDHLLSREMVDPSRTAVFGTSFGASVALAFAAQSPRLSAAVLAYPLPVRPAGLPGLITVPTLCITGSRDRVAARSTAQFRASTASPAPSVVEVAGARHHFLSRDLGGYELGPAEEAWQTIVVFLKGQLMPPPPPPPAPPIKPADPLAVPRTTSPPRSPSPGPSAT